jgi:phage terminase large subunit
MSYEVDLPANGWSPRQYQLPAWRYLQAGGKHAELIWHRRAGKDDVCLHHAAIQAMKRVANYWHMLPEASQARKAIWGAINPHTGRKRIDEAFPLQLRRKTLEQEMKVEFVNGSTWQVMGSDNFNSLVGSAPAGIVYSEWALANPSARAYLRPILAENNGWQLFITTPRGKNHAHRTYLAAKKTQGAFAQVLSAMQTGALSAERLEIERIAYIAEFGEDAGQALFDQEYGCDFDAAILGAVLGRWMSKARREGRVDEEGTLGFYDPQGGPVYVSSDLGFNDTASWWFWQPRMDGFGLVGYLGESGMDADEWVVEIQSYAEKRGFQLAQIWLPHDARNKTFATKHTPLERFIKGFGAERVRLVPKTSIPDRINAARRVVSKCWFDEAQCTEGVSGLTSWRFEYDPETRTMSREPVHDWASHPGDAFSYGCQMLEQLKPAPAPAAPPRFLHQMTAKEVFWPPATTEKWERI